MKGNLRREAGALAVAAAFVTAFAALSPWVQSGYRAPEVHVALETAAALIALLAAFLVFGRLLREPCLDTLLLACGLAVLALSNFGFRAIPAVSGARTDREFVWATVVGRLLGAVLLTLAAVAPSQRLLDRRVVVVSAAASVAVLALTGLVFAVERNHLPRIENGSRASIAHPDLHAPAILLVVQLVAAALYAAAGVGFGRRFERGGDEFMRWLALACVVSVFSRINYFLYPSLYTDWVYLGDAFRLLFFVLLLVGALREITSYWRGVADAAALDERRRIARDLHDGVAQELALITRNLDNVSGDEAVLAELRTAAARAHEESRRTVHALSAPRGSNVDAVLREAITDLGERLRVPVELQLDEADDLSPARTEALLRIASEAVINASRHAAPTLVRVSLRRAGSRWRLIVEDDGRGFDVTVPNSGYGLISMRERAQAVGGLFQLESALGRGTIVQVELP